MNTTDFLNISNAIVPDRPCIIFEGKKLTYAQVSERVNRLANALVKLGVKKDDRVAVLQVNCPQYVECYFAAAKAGAIFVPLNFRAKQEELTYILTNAEAGTLFVGDRYADMVSKMRSSLPLLKNYIAIDAKKDGFLYYEDLIKSASSEELLVTIDDSDTTILMYTSGTTGRPKGVPLAHSNFSVYVLGNVEPADPDVSEVNLLTMPLYHIAGMQAMLSAIYGGRTLSLMRQFETKEWLETVQKEKANRAMLVPTMLKWVIDYPELSNYNLSSLKVITYGGASMPLEVIKKAIEVFPKVRFINAFGQTETASTITSLGPEDHIIEGTPKEREKKLKRLGSSIGRPLPDVEMRIIDEQGKELPPGEVGEIVARGPRVMSGYWKDAEKTAKTIDKEGWLHTGDMGYRDEENYYYLSGRADDLIIRGGENISPEEIENVLYAHPEIEEVAVIGVPDVEWGQECRAVVVLKPGCKAGSEEIMEFCRLKLASFKRPRSVVFVPTLPRNPLGKVLKRVLREQFGAP